MTFMNAKMMKIECDGIGQNKKSTESALTIDCGARGPKSGLCPLGVLTGLAPSALQLV